MGEAGKQSGAPRLWHGAVLGRRTHRIRVQLCCCVRRTSPLRRSSEARSRAAAAAAPRRNEREYGTLVNDRLEGLRLHYTYRHQIPLTYVLCRSDCCQVMMFDCFILHRARPTIDRMCATTERAKCKTPCYGVWAVARERHARLCLSPYSGCPISASQSAVFGTAAHRWQRTT